MLIADSNQITHLILLGDPAIRMRELIREADPEVVEELKWGGTPVWSHDGILCTGETYKTTVKLTFAKARRSMPMRSRRSSARRSLSTRVPGNGIEARC